MTDNHRVLFFGALAVLGAVLASGTGLLSFSGSEPPRYGECYFDESTGDILRQECRDVHEGKIPSNELIGYSNGERESESFRVRVEGIGVDVNEDDPAEKAPQFWWLYSNDYTNSETEEQIEEGDFPDDVDLPRDLVWNDQIRERLERGSTCTGTFQVESTGEVNIETTTTSQSYNDEPDEDELYVDRIMDRTTVDGEVVEINEDYLECEFDFTELMNKGLDLPGEFVSWDGREPYIGGDDSDEGYGAVSVEFRESGDSDGDGVVDRNDECPNEAGEKANGCPVNENSNEDDGEYNNNPPSDNKESQNGFVISILLDLASFIPGVSVK